MKIIRKFQALNPPVKWLLAFIVILLGLSFLFAPRPHPVDLEETSFATVSSSRLYFKNVRSYHYDIFTTEKPPFVLYRLKRRLRDSIRSPLQFMIIENPQAEEAYIFMEMPTALARDSSLALHLPATQGGQAEHFPLFQINNGQHQLLAAKVYRRLLADEQMHLLSGNDTVRKVFTFKNAKGNAASVLEDYFKLTNKL